jgi:signal transduction histidine kinase/HAMP domain-containing protein
MGLSLRTRILLAFTLSFALFVGATAYDTYQLRALGDGLQVMNEGYLPLARIAAQLESHQERLGLDAARRDNSRPLAAFRSNAGFHASAIRAAVSRGRETATEALAGVRSPEERRALEAILGQFGRLADLAEGYEQAAQEWGAQAEPAGEAGAQAEPAGDAGEQAALAEVLRRGQELQTVVRQINSSLDAGIRRVNERVAQTQAQATAVGAVLVALALASGAAMLGWILVTLRPITRLTVEAQRVAAGDYSARVDVRGGNEIGVLAAEFNTMARALAERDRRLHERAEELKRLSGYLRSVLDTIRLGLVVVEGERVTMSNPSAQALWNAREGEALPEVLRPLQPGRHAALPVADLRMDVEVVPFGAQGRLVVGEDVTQRLKDQERLDRSERLALIGQMLAQVTHEVRNPLNAISLNAELLSEELAALSGAIEPEATEILATIVAEIHRLEQVTEHYLDLARRPTPSIEPEDLGLLVASVCRLEEPAFEQAGVVLELVGPAAPLIVPVDGNQLRRALLNVLHNARQNGAAHVHVRVAVEGERALLTVSDDGGGVDAEALARVFDPFFSRRSKGTGLGLAVTRQIVEDHGGRVRAESSPGRGFTIHVELPRS